MKPEQVRAHIRGLLREQSISLKEASITIGRNDAYLHQHLQYARPPVLPETARDKLAELLKVESRALKPTHNDQGEPLPVTTGKDDSRLSDVDRESFQPWIQGPKDLPVLGAARGGNEGIFIANGEVLEMTSRPENLMDVRNAYAVYVCGDSMEPRHNAGELVHVNPNLPAVQGDSVVIQQKKGGDVQYFVKRYISGNDDQVNIEQHNPAKRLSIARSDILDLHVIVGSKYR